ncbi:MAG: GNAT family N-acetyltransferase [Rhodobacteraceae bacterium]|jgi:GNAT superfamily N-acetyltransferase|nr:GNAT family N-acetyltransferase [Paracoccaceae bacterium]
MSAAGTAGGVAIRPLAAAGDGEAVRALFAAAADYVLLIEGGPPGPATLEDFWQGAPPGADPAAGLRLGLFEDGVLAGVAELAFGFPEPADAYLGLMLLAPAARGRGLGLRLLARVAAEAALRGAGRLVLAVAEANPRARAFWEREGFRPVLTAPPRRVGSRVHVLHRMARPLRPAAG